MLKLERIAPDFKLQRQIGLTLDLLIELYKLMYFFAIKITNNYKNIMSNQTKTQEDL